MSSKYPQKRVKLGVQEKYAHVAEIQAALHPEPTIEVLTALRNQFAVKSQETTITPQDERLALAKRWTDASPGLRELFENWEKIHSRQPSQVALVLSLISGILTLLSFHYNDYALGQPIMKTLLAPMCMRRLNSYIGGSQNELVIVTLKLFNVMSGFAGGRDRKAVLESFGWEIKSLPKLLNMRRRGDDGADPLLRPDIRTFYILFLLSFVDVNSTAQIKTTFLEQHRDAFLAIFKGLAQDHYSLARRILEICWGGIWSDAKLKRTLKIGLFSEITITHLIKLYDRATPEDNDKDHLPANLVHHFLLAICTRPGVGICFKDRAWYPKEVDSDDAVAKEDEDFGRKSGKIYNKILANVIKTLKVNEDSRQQELALKVLAACPELVAGYWSQASLTLEPRLSSKWITNIAVFGNIISLPVPASSFHLPNSQLYQPTPPPLSTIMENILPSVNTKINFSKGLQSPSGLVQHCTALALSKCLLKYRATDEHVAQIAAALEEDEEDGQWSKRRREMEREVRRRVPEFQVIVAFSQQKQTEPASSNTVPAPNPTKIALLAESAQRLLWLYHRCVPSVVAEARFDVGKLLQTFSTEPGSGDHGDDAASRLRQVKQFHVLNLLRESDQFVWSSKPASLTNTPLYILLRTLTSTALPSIKKATSALLQHVLSSSILFQEDPDEPSLWLSALPRSRPHATDDSISKDEAEGVVFFLDDCIHRCLKTPYRYIEELQSVGSTSNANLDLLERPNAMPSPLLMTVLEQLQAKISSKFFTPSQALGVVAFVRKLLYYLATKVSNLAFLQAFTDKFDSVLDPKDLFVDSPVFSGAIRREVAMLHESLSFRPCSILAEASSDPELNSFLDQIEENAADESNATCTSTAEGILNRIRTQHTQRPLGTLAFRRIATLVATLCPSLFLDLLQFTIPGEADVWNTLSNISNFSHLQSPIRFEWLYIHCRDREVLDDDCRATLAESVFTTLPTNAEIIRTFNLIMHTIVAIGEDEGLIKAHLFLLAQILRVSKTVLSPEDVGSLKETFLGPGVLKDLMMSTSSPGIVEGLQEILHVITDSSIVSDRTLVSDIATHWLAVLEGIRDSDLSCLIPAACTWIRYLESNQLFTLLGHIAQNPQALPTSHRINPANVALEALMSMAISDPTFEEAVRQHIPLLLSLNPLLQQSLLLEKVIALAVVASLPLGLDGNPLSSAELSNASLTDLLKRSHARWNRRSRPLSAEIDIRAFLGRDMFSDATISIITGLIYLQPASRRAAWEWLGNPDSRRRETRHLIPILHALLDSSSPDIADSMDVILPLLPRVIVAMTSASPANLRGFARSCVSRLLSASDLGQPTMLAAISSETQNLSKDGLSLELVLMGSELAAVFGQAAKPVLTTLVDCGLQWFIDKFADNHDTPEAISLAQSLIDLIQSASVSKPHLVETVLTVVIQNLFVNPMALSLATVSVKTTQLKPVIVNRHLQSIIQHPQFYRTSASSSAEHTHAREALLELLHTLFHLHPNNTCQVTHIEPLIRVYRGTLASADIRILSIFQLFESQRKLSVAPILARWSATPGAPSETSLEALRSLDPIVVLRTCLSFPRWRRLTDQCAIKTPVADALLYDPIFLMLLFGQMLQDHPPSSNFAWVELFRTNIVSLFVRGLSSKDEQVRELSIAQIVGLWHRIEGADLQERAHVIYVLNIFKNTLKSTSDSPPPSRLPSYTTLILMHALRGIFYPSNFIYPLTARFLLQRPELDTTDVPMLYGMLYSSSDGWKKERGWIIRFLSDGMMSTADWRVLKRRHTWDLLGSLYTSADNDQSLRHGILEVLANLTCNQQATTSLLLNSALLSWIEVQLLQSTVDGLEWIRIIENISVIVDSPKIERSTMGEWRSMIYRCLSYLLDKEICSSAVANFPHALPVILRLSLLEGVPPMDSHVLLHKCLLCLEDLEANITLNALLWPPSTKSLVPSPPHHALSLHCSKSLVEANTLGIWGWCVELLWRIIMSVPQSSDTWSQLVHRLLGWRTFVGPNKSLVGEWTRCEVVSNLQSRLYLCE